MSNRLSLAGVGVEIIPADTSPLPRCVTGGYSAHVSHNYHFKRGDAVQILWGRYARLEGIIDSAVFQKTVDYPDEYAAGYHVLLEDERVATVRWDQVLGVQDS